MAISSVFRRVKFSITSYIGFSLDVTAKIGTTLDSSKTSRTNPGDG